MARSHGLCATPGLRYMFGFIRNSFSGQKTNEEDKDVNFSIPSIPGFDASVLEEPVLDDDADLDENDADLLVGFYFPYSFSGRFYY